MRPDGAVRWMWTHAFPCPLSGEAPPQAAGITQDVTDRHRAEQAVREAEQLAGILVAGRHLAHTLNNDLQVPSYLLELLQTRGLLAPDLGPLLQQATADLADVAAQIRRLQQVVRVETQMTPVGLALDLERSTAPAVPPPRC
jgi:PAS domain-containing protein